MVLVFSPLFADNGWPPEHGRDHDELVDILKVKVLHLIFLHDFSTDMIFKLS